MKIVNIKQPMPRRAALAAALCIYYPLFWVIAAVAFLEGVWTGAIDGWRDAAAEVRTERRNFHKMIRHVWK